MGRGPPPDEPRKEVRSHHCQSRAMLAGDRSVMDDVRLTVPASVVQRLRDVFLPVEGSCEVWSSDEIVRRILIRGAMDYAKSGGAEWDDVAALAKELRGALAAG